MQQAEPLELPSFAERSSNELTDSTSRRGRVSRKERSNQRRQKLSENASTSPHVSNFTNAAIDTSESTLNQPNQSEKVQKNQHSRIKASKLHQKQTVSSMQKNKQRPDSSQMSKQSSNQKLSSRRMSFGGGNSGGGTNRLSRSKDQISSQSQASLNSKEKSRQSMNSKTERGTGERAQVPDTSPLTPLLDNIILHRSKQGSHESRTATVSGFYCGKQGKTESKQDQSPNHKVSSSHEKENVVNFQMAGVESSSKHENIKTPRKNLDFTDPQPVPCQEQVVFYPSQDDVFAQNEDLPLSQRYEDEIIDDEKQFLCEQLVAEAYDAGSARLSNQVVAHQRVGTHIKSEMSLVSYDSAKGYTGEEQAVTGHKSQRAMALSETTSDGKDGAITSGRKGPTHSDYEITSLKSLIVALTLKLKAKEAGERETEHLKQMLAGQDASQGSLRLSLDNLSQQMLVQVQSNRDTVASLQSENEELRAALGQSNGDVQAMKSLLQVAQQQITNDQAHISQQIMEMEQLELQKQGTEETLTQQLRLQQVQFEQQLAKQKEEQSEVLSAMQLECSEMRRQRDTAFQERDFARNESDCMAADVQTKDHRINSLEESISAKESLLQRLSEETNSMSSKIEAMSAERSKYMTKVETILSEQKELRQKDQTLFSQVSQTRDKLNQMVRNKDLQLEAKDKQIFNLQQSLQELQLMVTSLKGLSSSKQEYEDKCKLLVAQAQTNEMQITVLKSEVETATDFLLEQEQRILEANNRSVARHEEQEFGEQRRAYEHQLA